MNKGLEVPLRSAGEESDEKIPLSSDEKPIPTVQEWKDKHAVSRF